MSNDLTISEAVADPLIALMVKADGLEPDAFAELLGRAAHDQIEQKMSQLREERAARFYERLSIAEIPPESCSHC